MSVEIIGRAARAPGADSPEELFELLRQRRCTVTQVPADRWDQSRYWHPSIGIRGKTYSFAAGIIDDCFSFDPAVFGISQREAQLMDPQQRIILQLTWRAFESANIDFTDLHDQRVGVYVGASALDHANLVVEDPAAMGPHFMTGNTLSIVSNRISHAFGLRGPSLTVDTACSSSLVALDLAVKALEAGDIDTAIVGGVNALTHPLAFVGFAQARMLSPEGLCRAYDNDGMGYVRAEGGAVVILRRTDVAIANRDRSFARILASAVNSAGRTNGISLPSEQAQVHLLRSLYSGNGIDPNRLAFIEGHGTGTKVGDPAEVWAIGTAVGAARRAPIPIGSIKTNIGHAEPASGLLGLMKAVLSLENNFFPASLHFETPNETVDFDGLNVHVASEPIELLHGKHPRLAGVNSFGFGGTNAHVIISDPQNPRPQDTGEASGKVFFASAHTASALDSLLSSYRETLSRAPAPELKSLIAAAGVNRHHLAHRFVVASDDPAEILNAVDRRTKGRDAPESIQAEAVRDNLKIAFVFSGNGSQWAGMGLDAYRTNASFRDRFNVIHALFQVRSKIDLIDLLSDTNLEAKLQDTKIAQPLLFAIQASLADVLGNLGIKPDAVFGHSVGEVAAAYVSGAISLVDAVAIVSKRSLHQDRLAAMGKMAALQLTPDEAMAFFQRHGLDELHIAAVNSKRSVSVSGPASQIMALKTAMKSDRVVGQILDINYPFHHPLIELAKYDFLQDMAQFAVRPTQIPFISTVTGEVLAGETLDADYWWDNVRQPVQFHQATLTALGLGCGLFLEIGPRPILLSYLRETMKDEAAPGTAIASFVREDKFRDPLWRVVSRVIANGGVFNRRKIFGVRNAEASLPQLKFETIDTRHEFTTDTIDLYGRAGQPVTLAGWRVDPLASSWKNHIDANLFPDLAEHVVDKKPILPGSAFLDIAISAARQFFGVDAVEISNFDILRPLDLSNTGIREVSTTISPDTGDLKIQSRERLSTDDWTLHAVARCRKLAGSRPNPINEAVGVASETIDADTAYETARQFGLDYGPAFQLLQEALRVGDSEVVAVLHAPASSRHPTLTYSLHPISVDAAFHGLVAIFGRLSGSARGAPYIPVRFGNVRFHGAGDVIRRAHLHVRRVSANSLNVDFTFLGQSGAVIAEFQGCRFKRTYLRQPKTLEEVTFHETRVPSLIGGAVVAAPLSKPGNNPTVYMFPVSETEPADNAQQMLQAAVYRACYDIVWKAARGTGMLTTGTLPGEAYFQHFVSNCLYLLEEVSLAAHEDEHWTLDSTSNLPTVPAILNALYRERPDKIAEIVAINSVHDAVLGQLDAAHRSPRKQDTPAPASIQPISDSMLESLHVHASDTAQRVRLAQTALKQVLDRPGVRRIVELGTISRSVSAEFARRAADAGAALIVVEPRDANFGELSIAFETLPHVKVIRPDELKSLGPVDVVISASDQAYHVATDNGTDLRSLFHASTRVLFCVPAPSAFADFAYGLNPTWFQRTNSVDFPIGDVASSDDWRGLLRLLALRDGKIIQHDLADGSSLSIEAVARGDVPKRVTAVEETPLIIVHDGCLDPEVLSSLSSERGVDVLQMPDDETGMATMASVIEQSGDANLLYLPHKPAAGDRSSALSRTVMNISRVAAILSSTKTPDVGGAERQVRLGIVLDEDGATEATRGPNASALSAYLRVLRNEFESLEIHSFDISGSGADIFAKRLRSIRALLRSDTPNREWTFECRSGDAMEVRVVPGPAEASMLEHRTFAAATVRQSVGSQVTSIAWQTAEIARPAANEVCIAVAATGLNFRDVMWAMGMLPEEALEDGFAGATIGMECAGIIHAVGSAVVDFAVGDPVMAVAPAAFSTHVCVDGSGVAKLPAGVDVVAGATVPVAFLTAYYSLVELARLLPGETVLIHGGAGGVGLAALQIAKARGAKVFATAGSHEKRRLLTTLGADRVFNSRTLDFVDEIMAETDNNGVDVVLNSLFSEAMEKSLSLVKPFGRFLELGKRDFYSDTKIGLRPFRRNISYFGIDADQLLSAMPDLSKKLLGEISQMFERGQLVPLPYRAFRHDEITNAFRVMQGSGHIGKIVVKAPVPGRDVVQLAPREPAAHSKNGVHLVLGGIGGFGLAAANWLVEGGACKIALCTRRGVVDAETSEAMQKWAKRGVSATTHACDITDEAAVARLLEVVRARGPLKTIVHAAMVLDDALISNLTEERVRAVVEPKAKAADIFDRLTRQDSLDMFLLFSSVTTLFGNPGQANYVAANGYLEGVARARRAEGLPALAVGFGAILDTGVLARDLVVNEILAKRIGRFGMTSVEALSHVDAYLARDPGTVEGAVVTIAEIDMAGVGGLKTVASPLFEIVVRSARVQPSSGDGDQIDLTALVAGKSVHEAEQAIFQLVANEVASILRVSVTEITPNKIIKDVGLDSLMAMELGTSFRQKTGYEMPLSSITQSTTIGDVAHKLFLKVTQRTVADDESRNDKDTDIIDYLATRHTNAGQAGQR